jgi:hypothetical protein
MKTSESIDKIAPAMLAAQKIIGEAHKKTNNPFFDSKYADLNSVMDACKKALNDNEITILQPIRMDGEQTIVETYLVHSSGQYYMSELAVRAEVEQKKDKNDKSGNKYLDIRPDQKPTAQAMGSGITYSRRYLLQALTGVCPKDDDRNNASGKGKNGNNDEQADKKPPCPSCGAFNAVIKNKYDDGWVCYKKKDGCGTKWEDDENTSQLLSISEEELVIKVNLACTKMEEATSIPQLDNIVEKYIKNDIEKNQGHEKFLSELRKSYANTGEKIRISLKKSDGLPGIGADKMDNAFNKKKGEK